MIIGITGTLGAGKGTIVEYLLEKGFKHYSVRAFLTEKISEKGLPLNRDTMTQIANELRAANSPSYIAEQLYEQASKNGGDCIIESLRTPGEIDALRKKGNFYLFAVDCDIKIRYERITERKSATDHISFETFAENEQREMNSQDPNKQNLAKCISMADYLFDNQGTIDLLNKKVEEVLHAIRQQ